MATIPPVVLCICSNGHVHPSPVLLCYHTTAPCIPHCPCARQNDAVGNVRRGGYCLVWLFLFGPARSGTSERVRDGVTLELCLISQLHLPLSRSTILFIVHKPLRACVPDAKARTPTPLLLVVRRPAFRAPRSAFRVLLHVADPQARCWRAAAPSPPSRSCHHGPDLVRGR